MNSQICVFIIMTEMQKKLKWNEQKYNYTVNVVEVGLILVGEVGKLFLVHR